MKAGGFLVAGRVPPVFDKCCRYIASHSQPLEIQGIRPTLDEFKADFETISKHGIPTSRLRKLRRHVPVNRACANGPAPRASDHRALFARLRRATLQLHRAPKRVAALRVTIPFERKTAVPRSRWALPDLVSDALELAHRECTALVARTGAWHAQRGNNRLPVRLVDLKSVEVFVQEHHQNCVEFLLDANRS